jgi:hypothetical protein
VERDVMPSVVAFFAGILFAVGLGVSGMTQPAKVLAFLDVTGRWDPSLALVMLGAIAVHAPLVRLILRRRTPVLSSAFSLPARSAIDGWLFFGAAVFGVGWGLAGLCPGPALTVLASGKPIALAFVAAMLAGMGLGRAVEAGLDARRARRRRALRPAYAAPEAKPLVKDRLSPEKIPTSPVTAKRSPAAAAGQFRARMRFRTSASIIRSVRRRAACIRATDRPTRATPSSISARARTWGDIV